MLSVEESLLQNVKDQKMYAYEYLNEIKVGIDLNVISRRIIITKRERSKNVCL